MQGLPIFVQMMVLGFPLTFLPHGQISVLIAVAILEECCMASAAMADLLRRANGGYGSLVLLTIPRWLQFCLVFA